MEQNKVKQTIYMRDKIDLKDLEHDYQRMRKLAKKRREGILTRFNKQKAIEEKQIRKLLGAEFGVSVKHTILEKTLIAMTWVGVGFLISLWIH
jgi:transposase